MLRLDGLKIVVDCANGAAYQVAPEALWELGAEVVALGVTPNGTNINDGCGSTHPHALQRDAWSPRAPHIGLALDGDADRLIVVDEKGRLVDGDQLMALIALAHARRGPAQGRRGGGDGDVQPRARAAARRRAGSALDPHPGRRPLRARGDARSAAATSAASSRATSS